MFSLSQALQFDPIKPLELIKYLRNDLQLLTWDTAINRLQFYLNMLETTEIYGDLNKYLLDLVEPIYKKLGWIESSTGDDWLQSKLRTRMLSFACALGLEDCVEKSQAQFRAWMNNPTENK